MTRFAVLLYDPASRQYRQLPDPTDYLANWPRQGGYYLDESLGIGDLNGDGRQEFFAFSRSLPASNIPARWIIFETTGGSDDDASTLFRKTVIENPSFLPSDSSIPDYFVDDFNRDGVNDIAYTTHGGATVVMFGNGDFTFRDATRYQTQAFLFAGGDFNGDGIRDLAVTWGYGFLSYSARPYNSVLFGNGDGTFSELHGFTTTTGNLNDVVVGDFNNDGVDDITGLGGLTHSVAFLARSQGLADVATGDLNGDGLDDIVSLISESDRVKIVHQAEDETWSRQHDLFTDLFPVALELADADGDQLLDILTANKVGQSLSMFRADQSVGIRKDGYRSATAAVRNQARGPEWRQRVGSRGHRRRGSDAGRSAGRRRRLHGQRGVAVGI